MAMSDCSHCWETPCSCGWSYRNWTKEQREKLANVILNPPYPPDDVNPSQSSRQPRASDRLIEQMKKERGMT